MKKDVLKELKPNLIWYEKIIAKIFRKFTCKIYKISRIKTINSLLK